MPDVNDILRELGMDEQEENPNLSVENEGGESQSGLSLPRAKMIPIESIELDPENRMATEEAVSELAQSIRDNGLIVPIIVDGQNNLVDGERRLRACASLGVATIPAVVIETNKEAVMVVTNVQRENFTNAYMKERFSKELKRRGVTQQILAEKYGLTQGRISQIVGKRKSETQKKTKEKAKKKKKAKTAQSATASQGKAVVEVASNINLIIGKREVKVVFELSNADLQQPKTALRKLLMEVDFNVITQVRNESPDLA